MVDLFTSFLLHGITSFLLIFLNMILNVFYAFCLIFPPQNSQRKQPLTVLLGLLIFCTLVYCVTFATFGVLGIFTHHFEVISVFSIIVYYFVDYSITSYVWLNFYYCLQIVPSHFALVLWVKRNIRFTIYVILVVDDLLILFNRLGTNIVYLMYVSNHGFAYNRTATNLDMVLGNSGEFLTFFNMVHFSVCSCVMLFSSLSTARYLYRHIKSVAKSGTSFSAKKLRAEMRITITGICQGVLFFLYIGYYIVHTWSVENLSRLQEDGGLYFTITTLFISGTTVTLGIGQTAFRQRIVNMFKALKRVGICQKT